MAAGLLLGRKIRRVEVPADFSLGFARHLEKAGIKVVPVEGHFWPEREIKDKQELIEIVRALAIAKAGILRAAEVLRASKVGRGGLLKWNGKTLTSEIVRAEADAAVLRAGGVPDGTIVAGGAQACDPHERGHGPLRAHELIILDVFPRDARTGFFGDLTRTVVRGRASEAQRKMWQTVCAAQKLAIRAIKPRIKGAIVHKAVQDFFASRGYRTEQKRGRWTGFFHGTGHGLGLDLHEEPRISATVFRPGQVFTVEPGLYYPGVGGARHEDVVVVTATGCRPLNRLSVPLEL
jgi:Xaa-Pro aminopeptidase